jgi:hypothetical protein
MPLRLAERPRWGRSRAFPALALSIECAIEAPFREKGTHRGFPITHDPPR